MKPLKNIDSVHRSLLVKAFCACFPLMALLGWVYFDSKGILYAAAVCLVVAFGAVMLAGRVGNTVGGLYGGRRPNWKVEERYAADLSRARVQKMSKNHAEALQIIEVVLAEQPDLNEALFLKAQVLLEGCDHRLEAKNCLVKIFKSEPKHTQLYQYCASHYKEIVGADHKNKHEPGLPAR